MQESRKGPALEGMQALTDPDLFEKARQGDSAAFDLLAARHAAGLYRLAYALVSDAHDAEDVLQETFMAAYAGLRSFRGESAVKTWLTAILVRQAARLRRRRRIRRAARLDAAGSHPAVEDSRDFRLDLAGALDGLSPEHREIMALREVRGLSYDEIADVLAVPRGTVESRLHRARLALREQLKEYL